MQGARPTRRWGEAFCLGVLAVVPGPPRGATGPVRRIKPRASPPPVGGWASCGRRLSAAESVCLDDGAGLSTAPCGCCPRQRADGEWYPYATAAASTLGMSTRRPGPIVVAMDRVRRYWPLA